MLKKLFLLVNIAILFLVSFVFDTHFVSAACNININFDVINSKGNSLYSQSPRLVSMNESVKLVMKYTGVNCQGFTGKQRFRMFTGNSSQFDFVGPENSVVFNEVGTGTERTISYTQGVNGFRDSSTGGYVKSGSNVILQAFIVLNGVEYKSSVFNLSVAPDTLPNCVVSGAWTADSGTNSGQIGSYTFNGVAAQESVSVAYCPNRDFTWKINKNGSAIVSNKQGHTIGGGVLYDTSGTEGIKYKFTSAGKYSFCASFNVSFGLGSYTCGQEITIASGGSGGGTNTSGTNTSGTNTSGTNTSGANTSGTSTSTGTSTSGAGAGNIPTDQLFNPLDSSNLGELMLKVMRGFIILIAAWAVMFIVVGGVRMISSQGNSEGVKKAKETIQWAVAGVIVSLLAFSIVSIVQNILGAKAPSAINNTTNNTTNNNTTGGGTNAGGATTTTCSLDLAASQWTAVAGAPGTYTFSAKFTGSSCANKSVTKKTERYNRNGSKFTFETKSVTINSSGSVDVATKLDYKTKYRMCFALTPNDFVCGSDIEVKSGPQSPQ